MTTRSGNYAPRDHELDGWDTCWNPRCERWIDPRRPFVLCGPCWYASVVSLLMGMGILGALWALG